jgi:hypothetical protein
MTAILILLFVGLLFVLVLIAGKFATGVAYGLLNQTGTTPNPAIANTKAHYVAARTASNVIFLLVNKAKTSAITASTAIPAKEVYLLCRNNNDTADQFSSYTIMYWYSGSGLSEANCNIITDAIETYLDTKGNGLIT